MSDFERYLGDIERKAETKEVILTKFLDLSEQSTARSLSKNFAISFFGGIKNAERTRAIINEANPRLSEFHIVAYKINFNRNLNISHRNILGTLMSLGIKRNLIGDILVTDNEAYFLCCSEMSDFIEQEFTKINNQNITLKKVSYQQLEELTTKRVEQINVIVPSLRLDVLVSNGFKLSRNKVVEDINSKLVFINNKVVTKPDYEVKIDEVISYRSHGRLKLIEIGKVTKKNRLVITLEVFK